MSLIKNIFIVFLLSYVLISLNACSKKSDKKTQIAKKGILDLRNWDFEKDGNITLSGQWEFYWKNLYESTDFKNKTTENPVYLKIIKLWDKKLNRKYSRTGYATYRLNILTNSKNQFLNLYTKIPVYSSSKIFVNGQYIGGNGIVAKNREDGLSSYKMLIEPFHVKSNQLEIIIQVSNFEKNRRGGLLFIPQLGKLHDIAKLEKENLIINLLIIGGILVFMIYHFALFIMRPNNRSTLHFALFNLSLFLYFVSQHGMEYFINNYDVIRSIRNFGWIMSIPTFILLLKSVFPKEINNKLLKFVIALSIVSYISFLLKIEYTFDFYRLITVLTGLYIILIAILALVRKRESAKIFLLSMIFVALSGINDALLHLGVIESINLTQFGLFFFLLIQFYILSARFTTAYQKNEKMSEELAYVNKNLEKLVLNRTQRIENQNIQLEKLNATKDRFFSIIAHDLRGPVGNLATSLGLLTDGFEKLNEKTKFELLKDLKTSSDKTYHLLENLLIWSKIQRNIIHFEPNNILLHELVTESVDLLKPNAKHKQIKISPQIPEKLEVYVDIYMMDTVMRNLLGNAIKFTAKDGKIEISAKPVNGKVEIAISDTGVGIKQENLDKLFLIEHNCYTLGTNGEKGSGLGLILCKEFIEKHEGEIKVKSTVGKGSSFIFTVPCS